MEDKIIVKGAKVHNLKNIDVEIPKNKLVVFTGVSGSGKTSLAMDTIYAEGQRRYVESLSAYARQFLGRLDKPDVEKIDGLSPAIAIDKKSASHNPRSTVGTVTEIYDYLRLLFARIGHPQCPKCGREVSQQSVDQIVEAIVDISTQQPTSLKKRGVRLMILSPIIKDRKGEFSELFANLRKQGYSRIRLDGDFIRLDEDFVVIKTNKHSIDVVIDKIVFTKKEVTNIKSRLFQSVEQALKLAEGYAIVLIIKDKTFDFPEKPKEYEEYLYSEKYTCPYCTIYLPEIEPRSFSFNSPHGACTTCNGIGTQLKIDPKIIYNPNLTIFEGGIFPWSDIAERNTWQSRIVKKVSTKYKIPLDIKIKDIPESKLNILLYGTGKEIYEVKYVGRSGRDRVFDIRFEGLIPNLERRFKKTDSEYIRKEILKYMVKEPCPRCGGTRLKDEALSVTIDSKNIVEICQLSIGEIRVWLKILLKSKNLSAKEIVISRPVVKEIGARLDFLLAVGLNYITLDRASSTLAGGEAQRIRLASQIGSGLSGVLYVLDEPSVGLHHRDQKMLIETLKRLRNLGNTVIVVEHDMTTILAADYVIDFGPGAGKHGGEIIAKGTPENIKRNKNSLTGKYLSGKKKVEVANVTIRDKKAFENIQNSIIINGCQGHNLKNIDVDFPLGRLICVTGVSGSGKSTLISETLYSALRQHFGLKIMEKPLPYKRIVGVDNISNVINIDQSPIGRTPRSNPGTYTKAFDGIREVFAKTREAKIRGYKMGRFSFNIRDGSCQNCRGEGQIKIEMQFLPDIYVDCEVCKGRRYNSETLEVEYKGKNIFEILEMTIDEVYKFFENIPKIASKLRTLSDVGLGYLNLGQSAPTLSGGEAQRIKLAAELSKRSTGKTLYILDEPTTGLHFDDLQKLINILRLLVIKGNTVIIIEHNLDVIKNSDWVIDLGPEGGDAGGELLFNGPLSDLLKIRKSHTAKSIRQLINTPSEE